MQRRYFGSVRMGLGDQGRQADVLAGFESNLVGATACLAVIGPAPRLPFSNNPGTTA